MNGIAPPDQVEATIIWVLQAEENNNGSDSYTGVQSGRQYVVVPAPPLQSASVKHEGYETRGTYAEMVPPYPILEDEPGHGPR